MLCSMRLAETALPALEWLSVIYIRCRACVQLASSPKEVTETADITVAMLADPAAAVAVATGPNGAVAGLREGDSTALVRTLP